MATAEALSTKDQVRALLDEGQTDANAIADQLGVTRATVYNHMRNIRTERGEKPRKRGRPPAAAKPAKATTASRPAPPKVSGKTLERNALTQPKAAAKAAPEVAEPGNGRIQAQAIMRFLQRPRVMEAIQTELEEDRKESEVIAQWLDSHSR